MAIPVKLRNVSCQFTADDFHRRPQIEVTHPDHIHNSICSSIPDRDGTSCLPPSPTSFFPRPRINSNDLDRPDSYAEYVAFAGDHTRLVVPLSSGRTRQLSESLVHAVAPLLQLIHRPVQHDSTIINQDHAITNRFDLGQNVG